MVLGRFSSFDTSDGCGFQHQNQSTYSLIHYLGWNSWNTFKFNVDEDLVKATADILVSTGLAKLGYNYLNIDDGWADVKRDQNGRLQANATKFPNGIKAVADYVHGRKLKLGIYG